jgi:hypothetical protein
MEKLEPHRRYVPRPEPTMIAMLSTTVARVRSRKNKRTINTKLPDLGQVMIHCAAALMFDFHVSAKWTHYD